ncbi:TraB family protein, partial [Aphelenchoides avenae]
GSFEVVHDDKRKQRAHEVAVNQLFAEVFPEWWRANMTERDVYMTHVLHDALESLTQKKFDAARRKNSTYVQYDPQPVRIVAVIGEDHMDGIKANWGKRVDAAVIEELMRIPTNKWIPVAASALVACVVVIFFTTTYLAFCKAACLNISR